MDRHTALLAALALATACATGRPQSEATPVTAGGGTPSARLHALADEMWDTTLAVSPTIGTFLGLPGHDTTGWTTTRSRPYVASRTGATRGGPAFRGYRLRPSTAPTMPCC